MLAGGGTLHRPPWQDSPVGHWQDWTQIAMQVPLMQPFPMAQSALVTHWPGCSVSQ